MIHVNYLISCFAIPFPLQPTLQPSTEEVPIDTAVVFSHDKNPFDPLSDSFQSKDSLNSSSKPNPNQIDRLPIAKLHRVVPLPKSSTNMRQQRLHVFRPLFVYRQEQAMRKQMTPRPPIDSDRYYHYPYYPQYFHQPDHYHHEHYANGYPELYEHYQFKNYDYVSNDISSHRLPAYDFW